MNDSEKIPFAAIMDKLVGYFEKPISKELMAIYFDAMRDLTVEQFHGAAFQAIQELKRFPKVSELRQFVPKSPTDDPEFQAVEAWQLAVTHGITSRKLLNFEDRLINACIRRLGGLDHFARLGTNEMERYVRPKFIAEYLRLSSTNSLPQKLVAPLRSSVTRSNEIKNIRCDSASPTVLIDIDRSDSPANALVDQMRVPSPKNG